MSKRLVSASLTAAALALAPLASAKPPDLPADVRDTCGSPQTIPGTVVSNEAPESNPRTAADPANAYLLEAVTKFCLSSVPALGGVPVCALDDDFYDAEEALRVESGGRAIGAAAGAAIGGAVKALAQGKRGVPAGVDPVKHDHARSMYLIGERCRHQGDFDMAQNCYDEARRLCPESPYAKKAIAQLERLQTARDAEAGTESSEIEEHELPPMSLEEAIELAKQQEADRKLAELKARTETRNLYFIGERCREGGDPAMARRCYEQAVQLCPASAYGRKCRDRLQAMDANEGGEEASEPVDPLAGPTKKKRVRRPKQVDPWLLQTESLRPALPAIDHLIAQTLAAALPSSDLVIVPEETRTSAGGEEESEEGLQSAVRPAPATLFVQMPPRNLVVRVEAMDGGAAAPAAPVDLSDWLRDAVRVMNGAGTLRIEASRLGRLLSRGEAAVRALGCAIVEDETGNRFVVYPAGR